jgi:hypothetical protein
MNYRRRTQLYKYFPFKTVTNPTICATRSFFAPRILLSYAFAAEDIVITEYLDHRELDDALGLSDLAGDSLADARTGKNDRHALVGMLRQAVFGRLARYEDVNDAERLWHDPAMQWIVGAKAARVCAASASQMGRFETRWLTGAKNLSALADLSGHGATKWQSVTMDAVSASVKPSSGDCRLKSSNSKNLAR